MRQEISFPDVFFEIIQILCIVFAYVGVIFASKYYCMSVNFNNISLGMPPNDNWHQILGKRIVSKFDSKFRKHRNRHIYYEMAVLPDSSRVPDLSVWSNDLYSNEINQENLLLTIEIVHSRQNVIYSTESILEVFDKIPTLNESFIYNYDKDLWIRFTREKDGILAEEEVDYSRVLKCYMHTLLK